MVQVLGEPTTSSDDTLGAWRTMITVTPIRYPIADADGTLVWADELAATGDRPERLSCIGCGNPTVLRAGNRNRPHFAHRSAGDCGSGETALHATTIRVLRAAIVAASQAGDRYPITLSCKRCCATREGNLARHRNVSVDVDRQLRDRIRPDLLVRSATGQPAYVIEVVVTHALEEPALALYRELGLPTVVVRPTWEGLARLRHSLADGPELAASGTTVEVIGPCRFPRHLGPGPARCGTCDGPARRFSIEVAAADCWSCQRPVRILDVIDCTETDLCLVAAGCPDLPDMERVAALVSVTLQWRHSNAAGGSYLANICPHCKRLQGDNFTYAAAGARTDLTGAPSEWNLCGRGHWTYVESRTWPAGSIADRPHIARGLVGEPGPPDHTGPGVQLRAVAHHDLGAVIDTMLGGIGHRPFER